MERNLLWKLFLILIINTALINAETDKDLEFGGNFGKNESSTENATNLTGKDLSDFSIEEAYLYESELIEKQGEPKEDDSFYEDDLKSMLSEDFLEIIASSVSGDLIKLIEKRKMPLFINEYVETQIEHLSVKKRDFVEKSLKRASPYLKEMKKVFKEADIPEDLAYLPLIESGFVNFARSNKGATGMWQFMPGTAKWMGMKMDSFIDERKDPIIACKFAAKFLNFLYEKLGDWHLVLAAYNHGGRNIINELKKTKTNYFYDLVKAKTTPKETRDYVPRFVASVMIIKDLEKYSFSSIDESSDHAYYKLPFSVPAFVIAKRSNLKIEEFLKLNPALRDGYVPDPKYNYFVRLPQKNLDLLLENYEDLKKDASLCYVPYYIKQGDTLSEIALRYGISTAFILKINKITDANRLFPGQKIYIPLRGYQIAKKK